ncbi:MAG: FAD-dependent oxidoreductase [Chloroflexi bacterium]|nr:FAD-dependent oxidoreductase [Chloroflexota bacterium]
MGATVKSRSRPRRCRYYLRGATARQTARYMGTRYGRTIDPEYALTPDDIWESRTFDDVVHCIMLYDKAPGVMVDFRRGEEGVAYELPYRMLVPRQIDGLLAAGRAVNVEVATRLRARWMVMLTGAARRYWLGHRRLEWRGVAFRLARPETHPGLGIPPRGGRGISGFPGSGVQ